MIVILSAVLGLALIAGVSLLSDRVRVASPLLLVLVGIGLSLVPAMPEINVDPEWIIAGILPPLLYSASASMPVMDFRRELTTIGGLSVVLVIVSSFVLGFFFWWVIPDIGLAQGVALGAIVSPTDAAAISIVKRLGVSSRITTMLEGESLLNDATALAVLRAAVAASAATVGFWPVVGGFLGSVVVACLIGGVVGALALAIRARVKDAAVSTLISFVVPFVASVPAELSGASGLVAAVVAGLVTGAGAARWLTAAHRVSDAQTWRVVELVLEGAVFLTMGLQLTAVSHDVVQAHAGLGLAIWVSFAALTLTLAVRACYVGFLLYVARGRARRSADLKPKLQEMQQQLDDPDQARDAIARWSRRGRSSQDGDADRSTSEDTADDAAPDPAGAVSRALGTDHLQRMQHRLARTDDDSRPGTVERTQHRITRFAADVDYELDRPIDRRHATVLVWAGMRGAVTLAAAQTLPADTPQRSLLVLVAFVLATASLLIQGGTLPAVVRRVKPAGDDPAALSAENKELEQIIADAVRTARAEGRDVEGIAAAQRTALLEARRDGRFSSVVLTRALTRLDADEIRFQMRVEPHPPQARRPAP